MKLPKANQHTCKGDNVTPAQKGNSKSYTLSRLERDRPDLFERVCGGELSANAAAIEAGFRKVKTRVQKIVALLDKCSDEEWNEVVKWMNNRMDQQKKPHC